MTLPNRDPILPIIYEAENHPRHPEALRYRKSYVYYVDVTEEGRRKAEESVLGIRIRKSGSSQDQIEAGPFVHAFQSQHRANIYAGLLLLTPGDMLFSRKLQDEDKTGLSDYCQVLVAEA